MPFNTTPVYVGPLAGNDVGSPNQGNSMYVQRAALASRPAVGNKGVFFIASDDANGERLYWDDGAAWVDLGLIFTGGAQTFAGAKTLSTSLAITGAIGNTLVVDTNVLVVDAFTNRVGIGRIDPTQMLEVALAGGSPMVLLSSWSFLDGHAGILRFEKGANNTIGTYSETASGESLGTIEVYGSDTGNTISQLAAYINVEQDGAAGAARVPSRIVFGTGTATNNPTERMRIDQNGNVGIGTPDQFGGGAKVLGLVNATTVPVSNPTGGGVLYSESGDPKWRSSSGLINHLYTPLKKFDGISTVVAAHDLDSVAISGLVEDDRLLIRIGITQEVQASIGSFQLRSGTDVLVTLNAAILTSGNILTVEVTLSRTPHSAILINVIGVKNENGATSIIGNNAASVVTDWSNPWTLGLRSGGQVSGGDHNFHWTVHKI